MNLPLTTYRQYIYKEIIKIIVVVIIVLSYFVLDPIV